MLALAALAPALAYVLSSVSVPDVDSTLLRRVPGRRVAGRGHERPHPPGRDSLDVDHQFGREYLTSLAALRPLIGPSSPCCSTSRSRATWSSRSSVSGRRRRRVRVLRDLVLRRSASASASPSRSSARPRRTPAPARRQARRRRRPRRDRSGDLGAEVGAQRVERGAQGVEVGAQHGHLVLEPRRRAGRGRAVRAARHGGAAAAALDVDRGGGGAGAGAGATGAAPPARLGRRPRRAAARSAPPSAPGGAAGARRDRGRSAARARRCTAARSPSGCRRSVRCFSSPGVCGPRSISTPAPPARPRAGPSASSSRWRYFAARLPAPLARRVQRRRERRCSASRIDRLVVVDDRVAVGRLVARQAQRVEAQRVGVRRRALLLEQAAEDADLGRAEVHGHAA